ncbi:MAG: cation:proton antiporter, partial [Ilumatobacter sp.]|uniref:cation:proton antiporter domain-containing protein n=1 Tax=Ilumatobacter sp. TaxID=1967498 RepID=UPI001D3F81CC|nr:cation:proton antiporter [Ilumatobacter sp.]
TCSTFIPLVLGVGVGLMLGIDTTAAVLIGSFWASFTLITYPIVSQYGLTKNRAVAATVGASSITDTISLVILAVIIGAETGDSGGIALVLSIALGMVGVAVWCMIIYPFLARMFFMGMGQERTLRYLIVLIGLTSSALVADLLGIEALIGAFFMGVGLNRLVPNARPLMGVTDFIGNAIFIPTFLVSVGLLFDPEVMFVAETLRLAAGFAVALVVGKAAAAWLSGRLFGLDRAEVGLMFSISVAQAAATLAATIIGLEAGLYGDDIVNAVMVVVAVSLLITSIGTARYAPRITVPANLQRRPGEAVLLPTGDVPDAELARVIGLASRLADPVGGILQPIVVVPSTAPDLIEWGRAEQNRADLVLRRMGQDVETQLRADRSVSSGINRTAIEHDSSLLLLAWPGKPSIGGRVLGASYSEIIAATSVPVLIAALHDDVVAHPRVALVAHSVVPGSALSLSLGAQIASAFAGKDHPLLVGPAAPEHLAALDIAFPADTEYRGGSDVVGWVNANTDPGDLVIVPFVGVSLRPLAEQIYDSGRSILAVAQNPGSQPALGGSAMSLPIGGTVNPV